MDRMHRDLEKASFQNIDFFFVLSFLQGQFRQGFLFCVRHVQQKLSAFSPGFRQVYEADERQDYVPTIGEVCAAYNNQHKQW